MPIKAIMERIIPSSRTGIRSLFRGRKVQPPAAKVQLPAENTDTFVLNNSDELMQKRRAIVKYLNKSPMERSSEVTDNIEGYLFESLWNTKVGDILKLCGDDLGKIDTVLGLYGLACYADVNPEMIIKKNGEIKEGRYAPDSTPQEAFCWYLLNNSDGSIASLYERFGRIGVSLFEQISSLGFVKRGCCQATDLGENYFKEQLCALCSELAKDDYEELFGDK